MPKHLGLGWPGMRYAQPGCCRRLRVGHPTLSPLCSAQQAILAQVLDLIRVADDVRVRPDAMRQGGERDILGDEAPTHGIVVVVHCPLVRGIARPQLLSIGNRSCEDRAEGAGSAGSSKSHGTSHLGARHHPLRTLSRARVPGRSASGSRAPAAGRAIRAGSARGPSPGPWPARSLGCRLPGTAA